MSENNVDLNRFEFVSVESSNIAACAWDANDLAIMFKNGGLYFYRKVDKAVFTQLITAQSVGKFFHASIRSAYGYVKYPNAFDVKQLKFTSKTDWLKKNVTDVK